MSTTSINDPQERILSISEFTGQVQELLETTFPAVWVCGEISNFSRPRSGHCYFTLKDAQAQLRAVVWRSVAARNPIELADGLEVICQGRVDVYPPRGSYQLVVQQIQPKGLGALELALRKLREKLAAEGLFAKTRKRPIPRFPRQIAFVTSPTGAAIRDFLEVLGRRWRGVRVLVVPTRVQGPGSAAEIAAAIESVNRINDPIDVLVVGRGGGSLEDLWAFNEEPVVRAIAASRVPVVSAVGHEIDVTLADLAADLRALTPSEAAERVVPSTDEVEAALRNARQRLDVALRTRARSCRQRLELIAQQRVFRRPYDRIRELERRLDDLSTRSRRSIVALHQARRARFETIAGKLNSLSPLAVLERGYTLTDQPDVGTPLRNSADLNIGDRIRTRYSRGSTVSRVEKVER